MSRSVEGEMKKWFAKHYRHFSIALICLILAFFFSGVIRGEYTRVQISCYAVMLLSLVTITVNNRKNQALHEALISLFYAAFSVEMWTRDHSLIWSIIGAFLVLIMALFAINTYVKSKISRCEKDIPA